MYLLSRCILSRIFYHRAHLFSGCAGVSGWLFFRRSWRLRACSAGLSVLEIEFCPRASSSSSPSASPRRVRISIPFPKLESSFFTFFTFLQTLHPLLFVFLHPLFICRGRRVQASRSRSYAVASLPPIPPTSLPRTTWRVGEQQQPWLVLHTSTVPGMLSATSVSREPTLTETLLPNSRFATFAASALVMSVRHR